MRYVAQIAYTTTGGTPGTLYATSGAGFTFRPSDTPADVTVHPWLAQPALVRKELFDANRTGGASRATFGAAVLLNHEGALDAFRTHRVDGHAYTAWCSDDDTAAFPAGWTKLFVGTILAVQVDETTATVRLRDAQVFTRLPLSPDTFGGTNTLPGGVDGLPSDLRAKRLPVVYGWCLNVTATLVNHALLIYQVSDRPLRDVRHVYDGGGYLGKGADYVSQAEMESVQPAQGTYRVWRAGGMFRLGSPPAQLVTCDPIEGEWPADRTAGQIARRILLDRAGLTVGEIDDARIAALDLAQPSGLGLYYPPDTTGVPIQQALDDVATSVGAWHGTDRVNTYGITRLDAPTGDAVYTFTDANIVRGSLRVVDGDDASGLPTKRVTVRGVPNYTIQTTGLLGQVSIGRRARLAQPFQDATAVDATVAANHPLAPELEITTRLCCLDTVDAEATRQLALRAVRRFTYAFAADLTRDLVAVLDLGVVVGLDIERFGGPDARYRVLAYEIDPAVDRVMLTVWGQD